VRREKMARMINNIIRIERERKITEKEN